jgi:hypothetical protein
MAKKQTKSSPATPAQEMTPVVAAALAGVIYQARLTNRQSKLNIPESEVIQDVVGLWRSLMAELNTE